MPVARCTVIVMAGTLSGHIEQLPSGSWRAKVCGGTDPLRGWEIRFRKTCKTERAAQIELGKLLEQAAAGRQPDSGAWQRPMLVELYPHIEHLQGVLALLDVTAEHAPEPVSYEEVKLRSGLTDRQQRNDHAALTLAAKKAFGRRTWPVAWQQTSEGAMRYWMPSRMATWWKEIRK
jgi:hypothetical protein